MDSASEEYLQHLVESLSEALDGNLTGVYLHGSAVLGGYDVRSSDLDVLVVVPTPLTEAQRETITSGVSEQALPCPAAGLEMSIITDAVAANPTAAAPAFELHMTTAASNSKVVDGRSHAGDADLVLHLAVCRMSGRNLLLASTRSNMKVFGEVPRELLIGQLREELVWAARDAPRHYAVLNASRAWMYAVTGHFASKISGGEWAVARMQNDAEVPNRGDMLVLVKAALAKQQGEPVHIKSDSVRRYVHFVLRGLDNDEHVSGSSNENS